MSGELLSCPFCGGEPEVIKQGDRRKSHIIGCVECYCRLETNEEGGFCGQAWNTRTPPSVGESVKKEDSDG